MNRFRQDNTEGCCCCYSDADLAVMNWAFDRIVGDEELDKSALDHIAEDVQFRFDRGLRDSALLERTP